MINLAAQVIYLRSCVRFISIVRLPSWLYVWGSYFHILKLLLLLYKIIFRYSIPLCHAEPCVVCTTVIQFVLLQPVDQSNKLFNQYWDDDSENWSGTFKLSLYQSTIFGWFVVLVYCSILKMENLLQYACIRALNVIIADILNTTIVKLSFVLYISLCKQLGGEQLVEENITHLHIYPSNDSDWYDLYFNTVVCRLSGWFLPQ